MTKRKNPHMGGLFEDWCGIRCKPITDSSRIRSAIPTQADH